jgi:hypothetical protein
MPAQGERESPEPPGWWTLDLYDFLTDLPLEGWIWEFMRRARLKEALKGSPVVAMMPKPEEGGLTAVPELEGLDANFYNYYKRYDETVKQKLLFFPPSIYIPPGWDKGFHGQQYSIDEYRSLRYTEKLDLRIDMNRPDSVIKRDFESILKELRESNPKARRKSPKRSDWVRNRTLPIWDLRQFKIKWERVAVLIHGEDDVGRLEKVKTAHKVSKRNIDRGEWIYLVGHVETE